MDLRFHVLITSFEFASKDAYFFKKLQWEAVVVDEGHRLKGGATGKLYSALKEFRVGHRLLLTGTPLQNSIEELFNLLHFLEPEKFGQVDVFKADFESMDKESQLAKLRDLIAPHMLRRYVCPYFILLSINVLLVTLSSFLISTISPKQNEKGRKLVHSREA